MAQVTSTYVCPKGHVSAEPDYCSECGAKIQGAAAGNGAANTTAGSTGEICPDCGTLRDPSGSVYCEVCGYNFKSGARGEVGIEPPPSTPVAAPPPPVAQIVDPEPMAEAASKTVWSVTVAADPSLRSAESPEPPAGLASFSVELTQPSSLIGRPDEARAIFPEIALPLDEAVSRRHALLQLDAQGNLSIRDIGAANGTRLNGSDLDAMVDHPLRDGDQITLGHWSRLTIQAR